MRLSICKVFQIKSIKMIGCDERNRTQEKVAEHLNREPVTRSKVTKTYLWCMNFGHVRDIDKKRPHKK